MYCVKLIENCGSLSMNIRNAASEKNRSAMRIHKTMMEYAQTLKKKQKNKRTNKKPQIPVYKQFDYLTMCWMNK